MTFPNNKISLAILEVGDVGSGKTSLARRYAENNYDKGYKETIGIDYFCKKVEYNNEKYDVKIWDSAGQERFQNMTKNYIKKAKVVLFCFDLSSNDSFSRATGWLNTIKENRQSSTQIFLVGTKSDLVNEEKVSLITETKEIKEFIKAHNSKFFKTSAKDGEGVTELFTECIKQIHKEKESLYENNQNKNVVLDKELHKKKKKKKKRKC